MSKNVAVFVDVANLYYAARGQDVDVDYVALLKHATKGRDLIRAYAYSGLDPENENQKKFLDFLGKNGYRVVAKDIRKFGDGRVKANLDIELVVDLFRLADRMDVAVIVSGDGDFAPAIRALQDEGVRCEVISFRPNTSSDLFAVADEFHDVMKISAIGRQKDAKGIGAPEMPAKEINPDVGFREASPSVAAAALAAARGDGDSPPPSGRSRGNGRRTDEGRTGRGTGRGRSRTAAHEPAPTAEVSAGAPIPPASSLADGDDESAASHRRRRRGGRGRGRRGRHGDSADATEVVTTGTAPAEIGWEEVDSLHDLNGPAGNDSPGVDQEFSFEEADAATLAELGLSAQPMSAPSPVPAEPAAKPRARARASSAKAVTTSTDADEAPSPRKSAAPKAAAKPAAKPRAKAAAAATAAAEADAPTADKPAPKPRAARTRKPPASADAAPTADAADPSDQGIWQRFTSGRGTRKPTGSEPPSES